MSKKKIAVILGIFLPAIAYVVATFWYAHGGMMGNIVRDCWMPFGNAVDLSTT
ncbi:hypothetical protein [Microbulbifer sp.]|uniref:hypothetical protein n=1 Tax=Microbulbifer sp. TaxID=1908541 RepID=UPI00258D5E97|nr:hypothetical protein [Microbulbifer sp.]